MIAFGLTACISSIIVAYALKSKNRLQWSLVAFFLWYALVIIMLLWKPVSSQTGILFILASLSGVASAIWGPILPGTQFLVSLSLCLTRFFHELN
jgi:hypothetical protein